VRPERVHGLHERRSIAGEGNVATVERNDLRTQPCRNAGPIVPFLVGAAVGASAGAVAGTLLSRYGVHLIAAMIGALDRRASRDERDKLRFELLLQ
jgi:hypothetical protein